MKYFPNTFGRKWSLALVICCIAAGPSLRALDKRKEAEALALVQRAHDLCDLRAPGSPPFHMEGHFKFYGMAAGTAEGKYVLDWASPDQWREEITFPGFSQVRVGGKDRVWIHRNIPYRPMRVMQLDDALSAARLNTLKHEVRIKALRRIKVDGEPLDCVKTQIEDWPSELCFDPVKGVIVRDSNSWMTFEFKNYSGLGSKSFPQTIRALERDRLAIEVELSARLTAGEPDAAMFVPPGGSLEWQTCADPQPPKPIADPSPPYPEPERLARIQGVEIAYILVDSNGVGHDAAILRSIGPAFDALTVKTLESQWKFKPAMCGNTPVPYEVTVEVSFRLQ
jgi:hypothetical protein